MEYVYIVYNPFNSLSKIGYTTQYLDRRLRQLHNQSGMRFLIRRVYECKNDAIELEKQIHEMYKDKREIGEWFSVSDDDINYIDKKFKIKSIFKI